MTAPAPGSSILLVDDDDRLRDRLATALAERGYAVAVAGSHDQALVAVADVAPTHAVLDLRLGDDDGMALLVALRERCPDTAILMLTGYGSIATAVDAVRLGAVNYLQKPATADMILAAFAKQPDPGTSTPSYEPPSLARAEWEHIQRVLDDCGGNISMAARKLGLHRRTLQRKLQTFPPRE